ncbi:hypothetical protein OROHE_016867 [Orobanche hederae]
MDSFSARVVRDHLFVNGIDTSYTVWTDHGEAAVVVEDNESNNGSDTEFDESVDGPLGVEADSDLDLDFEGDNELSDDCNEFQKFVGDANKPLYPGCKYWGIFFLKGMRFLPFVMMQRRH